MHSTLDDIIQQVRSDAARQGETPFINGALYSVGGGVTWYGPLSARVRLPSARTPWGRLYHRTQFRHGVVGAVRRASVGVFFE